MTDHLAKAAELMARVEELDNPMLPIGKALTAQAGVYAAMAQANELWSLANGERTRI